MDMATYRIFEKPNLIESELVIFKEQLEQSQRDPNHAQIYRSQEKRVTVDGQFLYFFVKLKIVKQRKLSVTLSATLSHHSEEYFLANITYSVNGGACYVHQKEIIFDNSLYNDDYPEEPCKELCTMADALNHEKSFFENGKMTIKMRALVFERPYTSRSFPLVWKLWQRDDRDFVIVVGKEGEPKKQVKIHSLVLACASNVFDRMLQTDMKEKQNGRMEIVDFEIGVIEAAVEYFYNIERMSYYDLATLLGLLQFADKYDIPELKEMVEKHTLPHIFPQTIVDIANGAVTANSICLKLVCSASLTIYRDEGVAILGAQDINYNELENGLHISPIIDAHFFD